MWSTFDNIWHCSSGFDHERTRRMSIKNPFVIFHETRSKRLDATTVTHTYLLFIHTSETCFRYPYARRYRFYKCDRVIKARSPQQILPIERPFRVYFLCLHNIVWNQIVFLICFPILISFVLSLKYLQHLLNKMCLGLYIFSSFERHRECNFRFRTNGEI